jgi:hypothetical protein
MYAAAKAHVKSMRLLMEYGADLEIKNCVSKFDHFDLQLEICLRVFISRKQIRVYSNQ